ncbi:hypothetical protein V1498_12295 [Peribacillus sp. SCS-26]|uniref:hypothetical protein n=1 Tax=Paraperibacillus marinus TaxID=3115295 RepID=UPI0039063BFA
MNSHNENNDSIELEPQDNENQNLNDPEHPLHLYNHIMTPGELSKESFQIERKPAFVRVIGYVILGFFVLMVIVVPLLSFIMK